MGRGRIREGDPADLVVFDPETIQARSTYDKPLEPPIGIDLVMVNGGLAIEGDRADKHNFGRALRRMPLLKSR
jgi:N-acyl-D-amino-acid deacylase